MFVLDILAAADFPNDHLVPNKVGSRNEKTHDEANDANHADEFSIAILAVAIRIKECNVGFGRIRIFSTSLVVKSWDKKEEEEM